MGDRVTLLLAVPPIDPRMLGGRRPAAVWRTLLQTHARLAHWTVLGPRGAGGGALSPTIYHPPTRS